MSKPKSLKAYNPESETITAIRSDYAIVSKWTDLNPDKEDRVGYFVSKDMTNAGMSIIKASEFSKVLGITVDSPGFASNVDESVCDVCGLLPEYAYVCFSGLATVIDNGTCTVNGTCTSASDGTAVPSTNGCGYRVIDRVDEIHIRIHVNPLLQLDVNKGKLVLSY